jgi:diguanylate cyclase (GGDEF)-like protein/PAS domain S-box-containing protein
MAEMGRTMPEHLPHSAPESGDPLFKAVLDVAASLVVVITGGGEVVVWNRACERLTGRTADEVTSLDRMLELVPEEEHPKARDVLERLHAGESPISFQLHWRTGRGELRLISWTSTAVTDADGQVTHVVQTGVDRTESHLAEVRLAAAFYNAPIGMALADLDGRFMRVNTVLCEITGYGPDELLRRGFRHLVHPDDVDESPGAVAGVHAAGARYSRADRRFLTRDGRVIWVEVHSTIVDDPEDQPSHLLAQIADTTERHQMEQQLRYLADHDGLTGLINRRRFKEEVERHLAEGRRYGLDGALLMLDLDNFKQINDVHGHRAGDRVLNAVAELLTQRLRESDIVARIGGDEFAVLLPRGGLEEATRVTASLKDALATSIRTPEGTPLGASIGYGLFERHARSYDDIVTAADAAMYADKRGNDPTSSEPPR